MGTAPHVAEHEADRSAKSDQRRFKTVAAKSLELKSAVTNSHMCMPGCIKTAPQVRFGVPKLMNFVLKNMIFWC